MIFGTWEFQCVSFAVPSPPHCRALARTSWTTSCTSTGLCPSPSWQFVWSRYLLHMPVARGSLRWEKMLPFLSDIHLVIVLSFLHRRCQLYQINQISRLSIFMSECLSCFCRNPLQAPSFWNRQPMFTLITCVWSVCPGCQKLSAHEIDLYKPRALPLPLHKSSLINNVHCLRSAQFWHAKGGFPLMSWNGLTFLIHWTAGRCNSFNYAVKKLFWGEPWKIF